MPTFPSSAEPDIHRVFAAPRSSWPLHGAAASRAIERLAAAALPPHTLMQRAGWAAARLAQALAPHAGQVQVLAATGNNGGDGLEAAFHLHHLGRAVCVALIGDPARLPADAAASLLRAQQIGVTVTSGLPARPARTSDLAIDALLGLGIRQGPHGEVAEAVAWLNRGDAPVLSLDLPSGLDADTGWLDDTVAATRCVRADHTLSLLTLKPSLFTAHGRDQVGEAWFCDLGVEPAQAADALLCGESAGMGPQPRRHAQHKGSFGSVHVVGGTRGMRGAAVLAARAALWAGAGRVYLRLLEADAPADSVALDPLTPELMFRTRLDDTAWEPGHVVACGCGGGDAVRPALPEVLGRARALVLDADALNAIAQDAQLRSLLAARAPRGWGTVLTPHPLEAARLLECGVDEVQADRLGAAKKLAAACGAVVVLKGSGSVITAPGDAPPAINPTGNALLGTAGTGDVLAGWIAALWAQGLEPRQAAMAAVFQHGLQADRWLAKQGGRPLTAGALLQPI